MESAPNPINHGEILDKNFEFALKLAQAENLSDEEAIDSIANIVEETMRQTGRPEFMDRLDPGANHSETKLLTDSARSRLDNALEKYIKKYTN